MATRGWLQIVIVEIIIWLNCAQLGEWPLWRTGGSCHSLITQQPGCLSSTHFWISPKLGGVRHCKDRNGRYPPDELQNSSSPTSRRLRPCFIYQQSMSDGLAKQSPVSLCFIHLHPVFLHPSPSARLQQRARCCELQSVTSITSVQSEPYSARAAGRLLSREVRTAGHKLVGPHASSIIPLVCWLLL